MSLVVTNINNTVAGEIELNRAYKVWNTEDGSNYMINGIELIRSVESGIIYNNVYKFMSGKTYLGYMFSAECIMRFGFVDMLFYSRDKLFIAYAGGMLYRIPISDGSAFATGFSISKLGVAFNRVLVTSGTSGYITDSLYFWYEDMPSVLKVSEMDSRYWYKGVYCDRVMAERMIMMEV